MNILSKLTERELQLLKEIGITIENRNYDYNELYDISDKVASKEIELINAEKKGEYNFVADEYNRIACMFIITGNELYEKEHKE